MAGKALLLLLVALTGSLATGYWLATDNQTSFHWLRDALPAALFNGPAATPVANLTSPSAASPGPARAMEPGDSALGFMFARVADQYRDNAQYPPWSTPLSPAQAEGYQTNRYTPVRLPLGNQGHFTVTLEKFRFTRGEPILIAASLEGPQVVADTLAVTLEQSENRDAIASTRLERTSGTFFEGELGSDEPPGEYRLIVEARVDGRPVRHASTLTIEPYLGEFEGLDDAYLAENNLVIPVRFAPDQAGVFALSAQLFAGSRPIALLQAEQRLDSGAGTIELKAHGTVLANQPVNGPLSLRHLQIRQLPARPGQRTHYGFGPEEGLDFSAPDLNDLTDTPTVDPESERRAALLQQLADKF